jgi:hypothetical protein
MMDFLLPFVKGALLLIFLVLIALVSIHFFGQDNRIEEAAEDILHDRTGHRIDFTPGSENKKP